MAIATTDPRTGEVLKTFDELTDDQLEDKLARAAAAADAYRLTSHEERAGWLRAAADILDKRTDEVAELMTLEMGKTKKASAAEIGKCAAVLRYYADHAAGFLADEPVDADSVNASKAYAHYLPIGVVLAIMPWNFPLWQAMRFAAPALAAGNVGLLKHASNVPADRAVHGGAVPRRRLPRRRVPDPADRQQARSTRCSATTGSPRPPSPAARAPASRSARTAGEVLKKVVLELGGSDPFVVMPSADLAKAAKVATTSRCQNNGQSLHLRQAVHRAHRRVRRVRRAVRQGDVGARRRRPDGGRHRRRPAGDRAGPRGRRGAGQGRRRQGREGAASAASGPTGDGWWYPPTAGRRHHRGDGHVPRGGLRAGRAGATAPRTSTTRSGSPTPPGSGSAPTPGPTTPRSRRSSSATSPPGQTFINGMVASFPALPFGGVKASGHGRELAAHGIREFTNIKTVWIGE